MLQLSHFLMHSYIRYFCLSLIEIRRDSFFPKNTMDIVNKIAMKLQVGGDISTTIIYQMREFGRIAVCGSISTYNADSSSLPKSTVLQPVILFNQLKMEGFIVRRWANRWNEGIEQNLRWIREGKLRYQETVTKGFENMFDAFIGMLNGKNLGKAIVQV